MWVRHSRQGGERADQPAWLEALRQSGHFGATVEASHNAALRLPAETVLGVERTRATFLSYAEQDQANFTAELTALLEPGSHIELIHDSFLAMAQRAS